MRPRWLPVVGVLVLVAPAFAGGSAFAQPPLRSGGQKAVFDVVVEGVGEATRDAAGAGTNGPCDVETNTLSSEDYEYGRGGGLRVAFRRLARGTPVFLTRVGRRSPITTFHVRGSYLPSAMGQASRRGDMNLCLPVTETAGDEPECKKTAAGLDMALAYLEGDLTLELYNELPRLPGAGCGSNSIETASGWPLLGWHGFPDLHPEPLPAKRIFGHRHAFKVELASGHKRQQTESPNPNFPIRVIDEGNHRAVVRFVRVAH